MKDVERFFVAISSLATPLETEAKALAADLGTLAYEERLKLTAGLPAIVLTTVDGEAAKDLYLKLGARGHRVQICGSSDVVAAADMISLKHFQMTDDGLESAGAQLPWSDIAAIVHARHRETKVSSTTVKEKKFDVGRAVLTGGLVMRKSTQREVVTREEATEHVLYLFRSSGDTPWLLRELATNYGGLGAAIVASATQNFTTAIARFRARAPHARYDDSLLRRPAITDVDLYAHLMAMG